VVENKPWRLEDEVDDVKSFDIGLMPLNVNDPFLKGKCAFKAIEYMAVGSPVVASAVGANIGAIRHGATGYLVQEPAEWELFLRNLVTDKSLRLEMGRAARTRVTGQYSVHHVLPMYVDLFTKTAPKITTKRK
jgi:glycosyltransferase involved in cell wall biosynthesis